ncbi:PA14 domain-containing protein [Algirhabdus cladophorae]|uniref:PA14 domain-containing protein n=2 Tax=Pseudomonadota TaxID=1224 RepID=UPI003B8476D9
MEKSSDNVFGEDRSDHDGADDKEKVADAFSSKTVVSEEDQTRSALHYGSQKDGILSDTGQSGAPTAGDNEWVRDASDSFTEAKIVTEPSETSQTAQTQGAAKASPIEQTNNRAEIPSDNAELTQSPMQSQAFHENEQFALDQQTSEIEPSQVKKNTQSDFPETELANAQTTVPKSDDDIDVMPNRGPSAVALSGGSVAENASGAVVGTLSVIDPDAGDSHSFEVSDDRFEVVDGALQLKEGLSLDHEEAAQIDVEVTVTDSAGASLSESFVIDVADVNEGPSAVALSGGSVAENASGAVVGTLSVIDPDAGDSHSFEVSDDRFEVVDGALQLKEGLSLDHEEAAQIDVEVTVTDSAGASLSESFVIDVADVNEGPSAVALSGGSVAENASGAVVGTLSVIDPDAGDSHSFEVSDDRFEVVDGALQLKEGLSLDHEEAAQIDVEVTVTDSAGASLSESFVIDVADVNEGPSAVALSGGSVAENASGAVVGTLSVIDPDAGDSHSFEVSDDRFEVVDGALQLKEGLSLDHEEAAQIDVEVTVTDSAGASLSESFVIDVADVNEGPSAVALSGGSVAENASGAVVGTLSVIDPDAGDSHSFEVSDDRFEVVDGALQLKEGLSLDHEEAAQIDVEVTVTDSAGASLSESFVIDVADVNEGPSAVALSGGSVAENASGAVVGTLSVIDPDAGDSHSFEVSDDRFEVVDGALQLKEGLSLDHEEAAQIDVEVTVTDSAGASLSESFVIDVADVNEGPSAVALSGGSVAENASGAVVGTLSVIDPDAGDSHSFEVSDDRFEVVDGALQLKEGLSLDHEEAAQIDVEVTVTDSAGASLSESFVIDVADVNEGPSAVALSGGSVAENASGAVVGTLSVIDPDAGDSHSFEVSDDRFEVVDGALQLKEGLSLDHEEAAQIDVEVTVTDSAGASLSESFVIDVADVNEGPSAVALSGGSVAENASGAVVGTLSVIDPDAGDSHSFEVSDDRFEVVDGALQLKEGLSLDHEEAAQIDVEVTVTDSAGASLSESFVIDVADVNEGPSAVALSGGSVAENASGAVVGTLSVIDPDAGDSHSFEVSDDRFEVVDGALQLKEGLSLDHEEAAQIDVEVTVTDSAGASLSESFVIDVADVNEGPSAVALSGGSVAENASGAVVGTLSVIDPDAGDSHSFEVSDDRFEVVDGALQLKEGLSLDHEEAAQIDVEVTVTDSAGASLSESFVIDVADVNEGPSAVALSGGSVAENASGAVVGTLSVIDPDAGDSHSFEVSDDRFEVVDGALQLKEGLSLDHEEAAQIDVEVTVTDSAGASLSESFVIDVADVNEGPSAVALSGGSVAENASGAVVGTLSVIDPDAGDSHSFEVSDDRFEVVDGALQLKEGLSLDHEEAAQIDVEVTVTDSAGASLSESFVIDVADVNEGPSAVALSGGSVAENASGAVVGTLSVIDPDAGDSHSFEVSDDRFEVVDGALQLKEGLSLDHEEAAQIDVEVTVTDSAGASLSESFVIDVADVNEGPSAVALSGGSVAENASGAVVGTLSVIDPDAGDSHSFEVSDDRFEVVDGALQLKEGLSLDHEEAAQIDVEVTVTDSAGASLSESFVIDVADVNEGPSAVALSGGSVAENASGAVVGTLSVIDPDAGDSHSFEVSDDRFEVVDGALQLKEGLSLDHEEAAQIDVEVTVTDSAGASLSESFVIDVADVNEGPSAVALSGGSVAENASGAVVGTLSVIDPDAGDSHSFEVSDDRFEVVDGALQLKEGLSLDHEEAAQIDVEVTVTDSAGASLSESFVIDVADVNEGPSAVALSGGSVAENASGAVVGTLSVIDPDAGDSHSFEVSDDRFEVVDGALQLKEGLSLDHEEAAQIDVEVTVTDSAGASLSESFVIDVADVNEGPSAVALSGGSVAENASGAVVGTLSVIDPDAGDSHSFEVSDDRFEVVDGALQLKEGLSLDHEEAAQIDVEVTVTDSAGASLSESFVIDVADVNEGPSAVALSGGSVAENASGAVVGTLSVIDPDAGDSHSFEVSDDRFEVVDGALQLKEGLSLDHEEAAQIDVEVTVTDSAGASLSESFVIDVADVNEGPSAVALSGGSVAENASGAVVGTLSVIDPDAGDSHSFEVSDDRFEVVDGALQLKEGLSLDHEEAAQIDVEVTVTDSAGASLSESFVIDVVEMPNVSVTSGFKAEYFDVDYSLSELDDIDWARAPTHQEVTSDINYSNGRGSFWEGGSTDTFGAKISGNIEVEEGGSFNFLLGGDDGAILFVNGEPVIDNDGLHGFQTRTGDIELEAGTHHIEVRYFENHGHAGLKLEWEGPGIDGRELVAAPDQDAMQTVSGIPLTVDVEVDQTALASEDSVALTELPPGTLVTNGENAQTVGDDGTADITGWDTDTLSITPPLDFVGAIDAGISITVHDTSGQPTVANHPLTFDVNEAEISAPEANLVGGFKASYFDVNHSLNKMDDIDWDSDPTHQEFVQDINYANSKESFWEGGSKDTFGAKLEGQITVEEGGDYAFFAGGDDGVILYIDGEPVIDNDGRHGFRTRSGEVELEPGTYDIEVRYFENSGHAGLKIEWEGPDTDGRELVTSDLETQTEENGTFEVGIDVGHASDAATVSMEGLPADTILHIGDQSIVTDGGAVDLTGLDIAALEISPPPGFEGIINGEIVLTDEAFNGAEISTNSPYSLIVGDPDTGLEQQDQYEDPLAVSETNTQAWDAEPDQSAEDPTEEDVMKEDVPEFSNDEVAALNTDTYERFDW